MKPMFAAVLVTVAIFATPVAAQTYKWVDANGQKHFSNTPPPQQAIEAVTIKPAYQSSPQPVMAESEGEDQSESANTPAKASQAAEKGSDLADTCRKAIDYTAGDLPDLITSANRNLADGSITKEQHKQALTMLGQVKSKVSNYDCMRSKGKDLAMYQCLAGGAGLIGCAGGGQGFE